MCAAAKRAVRRRLVLVVPSSQLSCTAGQQDHASAADEGRGHASATREQHEQQDQQQCPKAELHDDSAPLCSLSNNSLATAGEAAPAAAAAAAAAPGAGESSAAGVAGGLPCTPVVGGRPHPAALLVVSTGCTAGEGDALQVLTRSGSGSMEWVLDAGVGAGAGTAAAVTANHAWGSSYGPANHDRSGAADSGGGHRSGEDGGGPAGEQEERGGKRKRRGEAAAGAGAAALPGLPVVYEDDHIAVVVKPPGIDTQGSGEWL